MRRSILKLQVGFMAPPICSRERIATTLLACRKMCVFIKLTRDPNLQSVLQATTHG